MKPKFYYSKNGIASMEKLFPSGMYLVTVSTESGKRDKMRCDDYRQALEYFRAFKLIAKADI